MHRLRLTTTTRTLEIEATTPASARRAAILAALALAATEQPDPEDEPSAVHERGTPIDKEKLPGPGPRSCRALAHRPCDTLAKRSA
jgi:hypothetical protein